MRIVASVSALLFAVGAHAAGLSCEDAFAVDHGDWHLRREAVVEFLKHHPEIPAFEKETANGAVPVLHLTAENLPKLKPLLDRSFGIGVELKPDELHPDGTVARVRGDHGMMRLQTALIDLGQQNDRQGGPTIEFNSNGIGWKDLEKVLPWRRPLIMDSYLMPEADLNVVQSFQRIRRASFFRTKFSFAKEARHLNYDIPNFFDSIEENCFDFCKSQQTSRMIEEIDRAMSALVGDRAAAIASSSEAARFIAEGRARVLAVDPYNREVLNFDMLGDLLTSSGLARVLPAGLTEQQKITVGNLLVSRVVTSEYAALLKRYQISLAHGFDDLQKAPVTFVVVIDPDVNEQEFRAGGYHAQAKWHNWTTDGQHPLK